VIIISSFSTLSTRNVYPATINIETGTVGHCRPEKLDCNVLSREDLERVDKEVPTELKLAGHRGGAGRKTSTGFNKRLEVRIAPTARFSLVSPSPLTRWTQLQ